MTDAGRPQDQGRRHRRKGRPSPATASLLARWHDTLRRELEDVITLLGGPVDDPRRDKLIGRGVVVARELGAEVDVTPDTAEATGVPAREFDT